MLALPGPLTWTRCLTESRLFPCKDFIPVSSSQWVSAEIPSTSTVLTAPATSPTTARKEAKESLEVQNPAGWTPPLSEFGAGCVMPLLAAASSPHVVGRWETNQGEGCRREIFFQYHTFDSVRPESSGGKSQRLRPSWPSQPEHVRCLESLTFSVYKTPD